jgi:hypothetical protein
MVSLKSARQNRSAGTEGTVVYEHFKGEMFVVEFCDMHGCTIALKDISHSELNLITSFNSK